MQKAWREGHIEPLLYRRHGAPVPAELALSRLLVWFAAGWIKISKDGWRRKAVHYAWNAGRLIGCVRYRYIRWLP